MLALVEILDRHAIDGRVSVVIELTGGGRIDIDADSAVRTRAIP